MIIWYGWQIPPSTLTNILKYFLKPLNNNYDKFNNLSDKKIINLKRNYQTEL